MEYQWVSRLQDALVGKLESNFNIDAQCHELLSIQSLKAPMINVVVDKTWSEIALNDVGYETLIADQNSIEHIIEIWRLFFI